MQFERLELKNFEGYKNAEIKFAEGLNIITGRNSTGKTAILEALLFALYGVVPGAEKKLLVSKLQGTTGSMSVKLSAKIFGKKVEILREGRLIGREDEAKTFRTERLSLKIDGREVPIHSEEELNREIIKLTGMGVKMFTTLVYAKQGELTNILEPKKENMDMILGITLMEELVEQLKSVEKKLREYEEKGEKYDTETMLNMLQKQHPQLIQQINQLNEQVNNLSKEVNELKGIVEKAKSVEVRNLLELIDQRDSLLKEISDNELIISNTLKEREATSLEELEKRLNEIVNKMKELKGKLDELEKEEKKISETKQKLEEKLLQIKFHLKNVNVTTIEELKNKIDSTQEEYNQLTKMLEDSSKEFKSIEKCKSDLDGEISSLEKEIKSHKELLDKGLAICPTCGQKVNPEIVKQLIDNKKQHLEELNKEFNEVNRKYNDSKQRVDQLGKHISEFEKNLGMLRKAYDNVIKLLEGATIEQLEQKLKGIENDLEKISERRKNLESKELDLEHNEQNIRDAINRVKEREKEKEERKKELKECYEKIKSILQNLGFQFKPEDTELKAKIAEKLPLSPEELKRKEKDFEEKSSQLEQQRKYLENMKEQEKKISNKISELQKRLERAKVCENLREKIEEGIEIQRKSKLKQIADEALRVYETLTDQRVYKAFRIREDDYTVEVSPVHLEGYIPAKRIGGGHQTLIALAMRVALLNVLNQRSLLILDEPTYGVDTENLPQLMSYFSEAAKKIGQTILVTHYGLGEEEAANIIKVKLAEDGSSTITSE
jgi:exonuclease SbcC